MSAPEAVPVRTGGVAHEVSGTGTVLHDDEGRNLLVLNEVGAATWYLIDGRRTVTEIADEIRSVLAADRETVLGDVAAFLEALVDQGLVRWR